MAPIITSIEVERSAEDVFAYATDPTRFHEWQEGVVDGNMDRPGPPSVGARCGARTAARTAGGAAEGRRPVLRSAAVGADGANRAPACRSVADAVRSLPDEQP